MPGSVNVATPTAVFPASLSRAFTEVRSITMNISEYHDGSSQRAALVENPRRSWQKTKRLPPSDLVTLRNFIEAHIYDTFYFYNPRETSPVNSSDPTGADPTGRYIVRVNSSWSQSCGIALTDAAVELIEVAPGVV